jgi:hypothetical protein
MTLTFKDPYNGDIPAILTYNYMAGIIDGSNNENARTLLEELALVLSSASNRGSSLIISFQIDYVEIK